MTALTRIVVGFLLIAHGLVHLLYIVPAAADPKYPFSLQRSWLLPEFARRPVAFVLMTVVIVGFLASALALWGVPALAGAWSQITILAASSSIVLVIAFWDRQLWIGVLISALPIAAVLCPTWIDTLLHYDTGQRTTSGSARAPSGEREVNAELRQRLRGPKRRAQFPCQRQRGPREERPHRASRCWPGAAAAWCLAAQVGSRSAGLPLKSRGEIPLFEVPYPRCLLAVRRAAVCESRVVDVMCQSGRLRAVEAAGDWMVRPRTVLSPSRPHVLGSTRSHGLKARGGNQ